MKFWTQLSDPLKAAVIGACALIVASFLVGGVFQVATTDRGVAYLVNRFTGSVMFITGEGAREVHSVTPAPSATGPN